MPDMLANSGLRSFVHTNIAAILLGMSSGAVFLFVIFSVGPDRYFFDLHDRDSNLINELKATDLRLDSRMDIFDGRLGYQEAALLSHGMEYDDFAMMLQSELRGIRDQISQATYTEELTRRYDSLVQQRTVLRAESIRLQRIVNGNAAMPATDFEVDNYAEITSELEMIDRQLDEIVRLQNRN